MPQAALAAPPRPAASPWSAASHAALRLIDGGRLDAGVLLAGVELRLHPGFKTYWRHPGDSGVPPRLRFAGSQNLQEAAVLFPAPVRFDDGAGGVSFGYHGESVLLPLRVRPERAGRPVLLRLQADYAVCERLCVPAQGAAELVLGGGAEGRIGGDVSLNAERLRQALDRVPRRVRPGAAGPLRVLQFRRGVEPGTVLLDVAHPLGAAPELFVEAPEPWFFEVERFEPATADRPGRFLLKAAQRGPASPRLTLTLVESRTGAAPARAIEVVLPLDRGLVAS